MSASVEQWVAQKVQIRETPVITMHSTLGGSLRPDPSECRVEPRHLGELERIHELLRALNDPLASGRNTVKLVEQIPVLAARCVSRALARASKVHINSVEHALNLIGNRGLEAELLTLLEDLTLIKSKLENE